jgi:hypothetical protein
MIKPGDKILLKNVPPKEHDRYPVIVHGMVKYLGKSVTVASIDDLDKEMPEDTIFSIEEDDGEYSWCLWMVDNKRGEVLME